MLKVWMLAGSLALTGCLQRQVDIVARSDTSVTLRFSRITPLQDAEDEASLFCRSKGLVPRLTFRSRDPDYTVYRYECATPPK